MFLIVLGLWFLSVPQSSYSPPAAKESAIYQERDFSSLKGQLKGISDPLLELHLKLYSGYVKSANELYSSLNALSKQGKTLSLSYGALKRRFNWEYNGMVLHELYFENLGGDGKLALSAPLYKEIVATWGSLDKWKGEFKATGMMRGIGWVILCRDPKSGRLLNVWIEEHDWGNLTGTNPLVVMDVWEHAYLTQFGLARADYIDAFLVNLNWDICVKRHLN